MSLEKSQSEFRWSLLGASVFTPSFPLVALLFGCLFLPGFESCSGREVPMSEYAIESTQNPLGATIYMLPQILGVVMAFAAILIVVFQRNELGPKVVWAVLVSISILHLGCAAAILLEAARRSNDPSPVDEMELDEILFMFFAAVYFVAPIGAAALTLWKSKNWLSAVFWLQLVLSLIALTTAFWVLPTICLAKRFLIGGILNLLGACGLVISSILQLMDGERLLNCTSNTSSFQLSLRQWFILLTVACVFSALFAGVIVGSTLAD